jgi:hypothetical protein
VLDTSIGRSKVETRGTTFDRCSQIITYVEDVVVMGRGLQDVEEVFTTVVEQTNEMGLEISEKNKM